MKDIAFGDGKSTTVCDFFLFLVTAIFGEGAGKQMAFSFFGLPNINEFLNVFLCLFSAICAMLFIEFRSVVVRLNLTSAQHPSSSEPPQPYQH